MSIDEARAAITTHRQLVAGGSSHREIASDVRAGRLIRIARSGYVPAVTWGALHREDQQLIRTVAAHDRLRGGNMVFVLASAGALHDLPLVRMSAHRAHVAGGAVNGRVRSRNPLVARHDMAVAESDVVEIDGIRCTSVARTVADLIRTCTPEGATAVADAALRQIAWDDDTRRYDELAAERFRAEVSALLRPGSRGVVQARKILSIADGRAQRAGESISRYYLLELGYAAPRLQVEVAGPTGRPYYVDVGLDDVDLWGEFDGEGKYTDVDMRRADEDITAVVLREKYREDWIRGTTGRRVIRWRWEHLASIEIFAAHLAAHHVPRPRRVA